MSFKDFVRARQAQAASAAAVAAEAVPPFVGARPSKGRSGAPARPPAPPTPEPKPAPKLKPEPRPTPEPEAEAASFARALALIKEAAASGDAVAAVHGPLLQCVGEPGLERRLGNVVGAREAFRDAQRRAWAAPERLPDARAKKVCGVCGVAVASVGGAEVLSRTASDADGWEEPHRAAKSPSKIHACANKFCRLALHLALAWARLSERAGGEGRVDEAFKLGWAALSCGVRALEGSPFHYGVAELLESVKADNFHQYAVALFARYLQARPRDPRAALAVAVAAREGAPRSDALGTAVARHVEAAKGRLVGDAGALERCAVVAATASAGAAGLGAFLADATAARGSLATQRVGSACHVLARKGAPPNVNRLANKVELAKYGLAGVPPTLVVGAEAEDAKCLTRPTWVVPPLETVAADVDAWVAAHGLGGQKTWFMKAATLEFGAGVRTLDARAGDLAAAVRDAIAAAVAADARRSVGDCKWVLQPAIAPKLFDGFKVSVRVYLLVVKLPDRDAFFLYGDGLVSRGRDRHDANTAAAQIVHGGEGADMALLGDRGEEDWWPDVRAATAALLGAAWPSVAERTIASCDYWSLLGLDFLPAADGRCWLLEANTGPRLWFDDDDGRAGPSLARVDARVTRPLLLGLAELLGHLRLGTGLPPADANQWRPLSINKA